MNWQRIQNLEILRCKRFKSISGSYLSILLKVILSTGLIYYVFYKLSFAEHNYWELFTRLKNRDYLLIGVAVILMFANWFLEALKWRTLLLPYDNKLKPLEALQAIWMGVAFGMFTPNRIGEYAGRAIKVKSRLRLESIYYTLLGNWFQMFCTLVFGILACWLLLPQFSDQWQIPLSDTINLIFFPLLSITIFCSVLVWNPALLVKLINRFRIENSWWTRAKEAIRVTKRKQRFFVFILSLIRYLVFTIQYVLLLDAFGLEMDYFNSAVHVAMIFFAKSFVPSFALAELGIRETLAILVFEQSGAEANIIFTGTFVLYIINLLIPALLGIYTHRRTRKFRARKHQNFTE